MKSFVQSPIPHLFRYELALQFLLKHTPSGHEDLEMIPPVLNVIRGIFKETEPRVVSTNRIVELWNYIPNLVFNAGEDFVRLFFHVRGRFNTNASQGMDLLNENRSLIHTGRVWRQPETGFESNGWTELFVFLFDNYRRSCAYLVCPQLTNVLIVVMTTPKEKDGVTKYRVCQRVNYVRIHIIQRRFHLLCSPFHWTCLLYQRSSWIHQFNEVAGCCLSTIEGRQMIKPRTTILPLRVRLPTPSSTVERCTPVQFTTVADSVVFSPCLLSPYHGRNGKPSWRKRFGQGRSHKS